MGRLDEDRQNELEPRRMEFAKQELAKLGYDLYYEDDKQLKFTFKDQIVTFFPYSGWHTGKSIKDGRGWRNLYNQIKNK